MTAFDVLRTYLVARASFTDDQLTFIRGLFRPLTLRTGEFLAVFL
jgi:hypothetical protein